MAARQEYTVRGTMTLDASWPVEGIGEALMECAFDGEREWDFAVSIDLELSEIEIECIVTGEDLKDALVNGQIAIHDVCKCAELPIKFEDDKKPCPSSWTVEDQPDVLVPA